MTKISGSSKLHALDAASENIFGGISAVECHVHDNDVDLVKKNQVKLQSKLESFCLEKTPAVKNLSFEQMLPSGEQEDFFWLGQSCEFSGNIKIKKAVIDNHKRHKVEFYDAYSSISIDSKHTQQDSDTCLKDGSTWNDVLSGSIGIFTKQVVLCIRHA